MNPAHRTRAQAGFTFAELAFAMVILVVTSAVLVNHLTMSLQSTTTERDKMFAMSKAQSILGEMQSFVDKALPGDSGDLDSLDDGVVNRPTLTIARDGAGNPIAPDNVISGNSRTYGGWQWSRRITVQPFPGTKNRNVRYSTVRVYKRDPAGIERVAAELSAVVNAPGTAFPTTQVFDLYLLAIENIPGWWVFMDSIRPFVESTITDLETRNPGLEVRTHWITKASFGRNPVYRPHFNESVDSTTAHSDIYYYPGKMPTGSASPYYYVPANIHAHIDIDGVDAHGHDAQNPHPYSLCDYWNHAMRYPDELALWNARVDAVTARETEIAAALAAGTTLPPVLDDMSKEPTLRLFLEDLNTNPAKYKNALIINLHGELLPMPSLRNYSDAARDPGFAASLTNIRAVTHPEQLRTLRDPAGVTTESAVFRVYAYHNADPNVAYTGPTIMPYPIALEVMGMDLTDAGTPEHDLRAGVELRNLPGGVTVGGSNAYPAWVTPNWGFGTAKVAGDTTLVADEMYYDAEFVVPGFGQPSFTRILLYNTPCVTTKVGNGGLDNNERSQLYRMGYVPSPCEAARDFSRTLAATTSSGVGPKNTARWRLTIPKQAFTTPMFTDPLGMPFATSPAIGDQVLGLRTRIWTSSAAATSGTMWPPASRNAPENLSTTYTWWSDSRDDVPITERSQFQGDPRHCPYKDLFKTDADFPDGYNWYFDDLTLSGEDSRPDYPGLETTKLAERWMGRMNVDVPRLFELLRKGVVASNCVYTTLTGWSYYYMGMGNDIGSDSANGYPSSIPVDLTPHNGSGSGFLNTITSSRTFVREAGAGTGYWWSMPWLGELSPDSVYSTQWYANDASGTPIGNLTAGTVAGRFYQATINSVHSGSIRQGYGVTMSASHQNTSSEGCTTFFNIGTGASSTFHHTSSSGNGTLTAIGTELATNYNFRVPTTAPVSRPFGVAASASGGVGTEWSLSPYSTQRYSGSLYKTYFSHGSGTGSGLVKLANTGNTDAAYIVVNGFDRTVESGSTFIAKFAVLSLIHSFFEAGKTANTLRIKQPARVEIKAPTDVSELENPTDIDIVLQSSWTRWDGQPYAMTGSYSESEGELRYVLTYSNDGGTTWRYIQDDAVATPAELPSDPKYIVADGAPGDETVTWSVPSTTFPQASYYLRVDCYRDGAQIHYSYHKTKLFIKR